MNRTPIDIIRECMAATPPEHPDYAEIQRRLGKPEAVDRYVHSDEATRLRGQAGTWRTGK